jgi:hypothetical protein
MKAGANAGPATRMRKHPRGLLSRSPLSLRKKVARELDKAHRELTSADFKGYLARRSLVKSVCTLLYGVPYIPQIEKRK